MVMLRLARASGHRSSVTLNLDDPMTFDLNLGVSAVHPLLGSTGQHTSSLTNDPLAIERCAIVAADLEAIFEKDLSPWMRPAQIHMLKALPRTTGGKVDYSTLAASISQVITQPRAFGDSVTAELLSGLWQDVLGVSPRTQEDNFFACGGHSLQGVRLMARIASTLGVQLPLSTLFRNPTFSGLLAAIEGARGSEKVCETLQRVRAPSTMTHFPLTAAQARLWFLERLTPGTSAYHMPVALRLTGVLDVSALRRAFNLVVDRHETLRANFGVIDAEPVQWFASSTDIDVPLLTGMCMSHDETERWIETFGRKPFALSTGRCFRVAILELEPQCHLFVMVIHHLISDGWSMRVLTEDLSRAYLACKEVDNDVEVVAFPELPFTFSDYAYLQQAQAATDASLVDLQWWVDRLRGNQVSTLPVYPRPASRAGKGAGVDRVVSMEAVEVLRSYARSADATLHMLLFTAFSVLVARHGVDRDITIGTPVANRPDDTLMSLIGFFANTVALRVEVSLDASFRQLLAQVRDTIVSSFDHQSCAFERIVDALHPVRDLSVTPVFQLWFAFLDMELLTQEVEGLRIAPISMKHAEAQFDLSLSIALTSSGLTCSFTYDTELFPACHIEKMADRYLILLEQLAESFDKPAGDIELLTDRERTAIREDGLGGCPIRQGDVASLLKVHAAQSPNTIALIEEDMHWSYAQLDRLVDVIAYAFSRQVEPGCTVGICMLRSWRLLPLILGAYRAGVPFVLLDPRYPPAARESICADAQVGLIVDETNWHSLISGPRYSSATPLCESALAYICFTSGSTGQPKGVRVSRGALDAFLGAFITRMGATSDLVMLAVTVPNFDIALLEWLPPICVGARIVVAPATTSFEAHSVIELIERQAVNTVQCTPSMWRLMLAGGFQGCRKTMTLLSGGEALAADIALELTSRCARLLNFYGPTETTIYSICHQVHAGDSEAPPIGRPILGTRSYVLDERMQPVAYDVIAELYLAGAGVADGYANRPSETARRFVPEINGSPGSRMYATGDLVRQKADGELLYVGRVDNEVKLHGMRIDLTGIESVLLGWPDMSDVCALVVGEGLSARIVVSCICTTPDMTLGSVRERAARELPVHMLPEQLLLVDVLPRTATGKRDRKALAVMAKAQVPENFIDGRSDPVLEGVRSLCSSIVGGAVVKVDDNFFADLGGHSLMALRLIESLQKRFSIQLPLRVIFEAPTVRGIAERVALAMLENSPAISQPVARSAREGLLPLSFAQQRLWFLSQLHPDSALYNIPVAVRLDGRLDPAALQQALTAVVERHEALRTTFPLAQDLAYQHIHPAQVCALPLIDLTAEPEDERLARSQALVRQEAAQPFDLANGPLLRTQLLKLDDQQHILLLTMHHIVSDAWSAGVLTQELSQLYADFSQGRASSLVPLEIQYADYALWQREHLQGARLDEQLTYWKQTLDAAPALLELPTDRPRPAVQSYRGHTVACEIDADLTVRIKALGQQHGTTLFMTLLASYGVLLQRYSHQHDLVIGSPIANRNHPGIQPLIGFFVNTLALRLRIDGQQAFTDLLAQVREHTLNAYAHQDLPFEQLIEELKPVRSLAYSPLFQVMFAVHNAPAGELVADGLTFQGVEAPATLAKFDLSLGVTEVNGCLQATFEYSTDLFDQARIERMAHHWLAMLEQLTQQPDTALRELHLLPAKDYRQIVHDWNATDVQRQPAQCVHHLFEAQAARTPDAVALVYQDQQVSYRALNRQANQLAHYLIQQGVQCDELVGVFMERSVQMIVALLGILKAGAAYTPLDPDYPGPRIAYMLDDAGVKRVLTQHSLLEQLPGDYATLCLDSQAERFKACPSTNPVTGVTPANLAYCIYTSGSTGRPKGVANPHAGVVNRLVWMQEEYKFETVDVFLQKTAFGFDVSVWEFFLPLMVGARLVVAEPNMHKDLDYMRQIISEQQVTALHFVPSMLHAFIADPVVTHVLKKVFCSGEALPEPLQNQFFDAYPGVYLHNLYGPTEAAIDVSYWQCQSHSDTAGVPIGTPIANIELYALDDDFNVVPVGVNGELYIGGVGVARGYNKAAAMSAERFIPNLFSQQGTRLYRTGDLVRWREDGQLEYLGRQDHQIKLRGFRIEPGEIDARLQSCPGIHQASVMVREDVPGQKQLVAYFTAETPESTLTTQTVQAWLRDALPDYMVPAAFVRLDHWPLNDNGKQDRKALPAPNRHALSSDVYEAPQGKIETILAGIWAEVLSVEPVGRSDNFFALGGHSLLAVTLIQRMRQHGMRADIKVLFSQPTLAALAASLSQELELEVPDNLIPVDCQRIEPHMLPLVTLDQAAIDQIVEAVPGGAANIQDIYALAPLQEGILYHHVSTHEGDPFILNAVLELDSETRVVSFVSALHKVMQRHDSLRTAVFWKGLDTPVQVVLRSAFLSSEKVELDPADGDLLDQMRERFDARSFRLDISQAPMLCLRHAWDPLSQRYIMALVFHHLILDHVALAVIMSEIQSLLVDDSAQLPTPVPYRNYIAQTRLRNDDEAHERFFRDMLHDVDEPTLPFCKQSPEGALQQVRQTLDGQVSRRIRHLARSLSVSAASLMHLAWARVVGGVSARDDVVFGTILVGRMQAGEGAERALGMFINTLPIRVELRAQTVVEAVTQVHARLTGLLEHEHAPLALAQRCSGVPAPAPLFGTLLNFRYSPADDSTLAHDAWRGIRGLDVHERTGYPLALAVDDTGEAFTLTVQATNGIDAQRVFGYLQCALHNLLDALERAPLTPISQLSILPQPEQERVLHGFNAAPRDYPRDELIHALFEQQARRTPDACAVSDHRGLTLSYDALNRQANQLAHRLIAQGVVPDARVAVSLYRSNDLVVALLAILKAGGAYVPVDPDLPVDRRDYMLRDSAPVVMLTSVALQDVVARANTPVLLVDAETTQDSFEYHNPDPVALGLTATHLAYVIYTSGSTGTPKGVLSEHRGVVNLLLWVRDEYQVDEADHILQKTPFGFDVSVWEFFLPLLSGARLYMARPGGHQDPAYLTRVVREQRITLLHFVPSMLEVFLEHHDCRGFEALRKVWCIGEALPRSLQNRFEARLQGVELHNLYGPTEASVIVTAWHCRSDDQSISAPAGRPIANINLYILDAHGQPTPMGVAGEINIGGIGVARGYLNLPELSAERFLQDPFDKDPLARRYRTGDLGRWLDNGTIEYLGRNDFQVKIRGQRIELGEIEARLALHPAVKETVVMARDEADGEKRLVAYFTSGKNDLPEISELREHLQGYLPHYMLPAAYVGLEAFPLTANGKLDRKALPAPDALSGRGYEPPQGELETVLAVVWEELFKVERVGRHDDFFELGGHSLLALHLIENLQKRFDIQLPLRAIFEGSTIRGIAEHIALAILENAPAVSQPAPRGAREGQLPLSFAQQRLWFLSQLQPDSALYNLPVAVRLVGRLDPAALQQALTAVVERHEALRTTFPVVQGQAHQHIHPPQVCALPLIDLTSWPEDERLARSQVLVRQEAAQPFDLANGPLLRTQLLKLDDQQHILLLTMHHIVSDAWSAGVLTQELSQLYADFSQGRASSLVPLEIQYADYALWQREHLQGARLDEQLTYWKQTLDAAPALLELPTDRPRPAVQSYRGHTVACEIDAALTARIKALGQQHGTTLFMTLLASYGVLLQRYSHQHDLVIGSPIANRNHPGIQPLIGFFVNTLALRLRIDGQQAFTDLLAQVREHTLNAYAHQDLPFEQLIEELKPVRSLAYSPLFQVMFAVHNAPAGELMADGLTFQGVEAPATLAKFDLSLGVTEVNGCLQATFEYSTDLFDQARIERMAHHWLAMLEQLTQQPDTALRELHLLPAKDYRQIVHDWNATDVQRRPAQCVHHLFEAQAARTPDAVALVYQDQQVSYRALNRQANQLAHYLIQQGVQCDELVGVFMERSVQMIVALLGILKAGAAYTPLDPDYPGPRIAYMLDDAGVKRVLTQHSLLEQLPGDYATLCLDSQAERFKACPTSNPVTGVTPANLAYCIYTSGSTGRPKGVAVAHGALAMHCQTIGARYQLTAHDREFHFLSISFDGAHERWITPLFFGACVVLKEQALWGAKQTYETLLAQGITVAAFPPSYLQQLADWSAQQGRAPTVNTYCFAGEAFGRDTLHHIIKHLSPKWIINGYGPTETVITPTIWRADAQSADFSGGYAPIGNGVGERELYVLDQDYNVVPIGVSGELYIGGEGLARGYLNASLFTAERFIPNPFCQLGTRLYRTGDLVRWRDDGQLEYLGRLDHQIKLRGFRIELAEIEAALRNQPQVDEVVVLVREDVPGIKQLVAYVVGDSAQVLNLQAALRQQLPGYMVPSQFVFLQALPLLPNGKTDRQALPAPQASREHLEDRYVAARNETEALLVALYEEVLKREQVGIHDSFFELGGHSLLAMQLIARLHEELNIDLPVRAVFEMPSIEPLAVVIAHIQGSLGSTTSEEEYDELLI
ncbi:amino acid adenylation domain-containing protein [Pseudomonas synxantha]|uniref:amino acid adenylation domain-containing protein n=2 Tax=Pseudomonas fluorescens group TaxID=136843 RepID=UPI003D662FF4